MVRIVDVGRGPQIEGQRLTVLDVFYYLHRGHDFAFIQRALPSLTREQFDAVVDYVKEHRGELEQEDREVEVRIRCEIALQATKGLRGPADGLGPVEQRAARLKEKMQSRMQDSEQGGGCSAD